jgi:hypothetical protein
VYPTLLVTFAEASLKNANRHAQLAIRETGFLPPEILAEIVVVAGAIAAHVTGMHQGLPCEQMLLHYGQFFQWTASRTGIFFGDIYILAGSIGILAASRAPAVTGWAFDPRIEPPFTLHQAFKSWSSDGLLPGMFLPALLI